jgi:uncharacterized protein
MGLQINVRHLQEKNLVLKGEITAEELEVTGIDDLVKATVPLKYDLEAQLFEHSVLIQGSLCLPLKCECSRCLKAYDDEVYIEHWACHLALIGEEQANVVNDCVDLTPYIREDILLSFPQHPLCEADCSGLSNTPLNKNKKNSGASQSEEVSSAWAELNKLKLER